MIINCSKYHGCANDFICVDGRQITADWAAVARRLCDRHTSVGADGVVLLLHSDSADLKMVIYNADGTRPQMCGNGLRCLVAFARDQGIVSSDELVIETDAGRLPVRVDASSTDSLIAVDMGTAKVGAALPSADFAHDRGQHTVALTVDGRLMEGVPVSMGNPHVVLWVDDVATANVTQSGPLIEGHSYFPNNINVEFVQVVSPTQLAMRVWERGVGETRACGTGACAAVVAGMVTGQCESRASVTLPGGELTISVDPSTYAVTMTGPAVHVFDTIIQI